MLPTNQQDSAIALTQSRSILSQKPRVYYSTMTDMKHTTPKTLLWVDLEMTGLDPTKDLIVEVAAIVTDWNFNELGRYESGVKQSEAELRRLFAANQWTASRPETANEIARSLTSPAQDEVEAALLQLVNAHVKPDEVALLAGNSIHCDRGFIKTYWPALEKRLHYRMLDVTAWKVVMQAKYGLEFAKKETHQALADIEESIAELQFYLDKSKLGKL